MKKKYEVQNPRSIPEGTHVLSFEGTNYYAGDTLKADREAVADLVARGFLKEVKRG